MKPMGSLPTIFNGDRTTAEGFLEEVKQYLRLNGDVPGYDSPIKKVAFTLTLIKGPDVEGWVKTMGTFVDGLDRVTQNVPAVWDQFLDQFEDRFADTQSDARACAKLKTLKMRFPDIDGYIAQFKDLIRRTKYQTDNTEAIELFMEGLPHGILKDVMHGGVPDSYLALKQKAVNCTRSTVLVNNIINAKSDRPNFGQFQRGNQQNNPRNPLAPQFPRNFMHNFNNNMFQQHPMGQGPPRGGYNSTNAPRSYANIPVPMDVD